MRVTTASRAARIVRVIGAVLLIAAISAVAVRAGFWQWGRHEARAEAIALYEANAQAEPVPLAAAVPPGAAVGDAEWTTVSVSGTFDSDSLTLLRNRPIDRERVYQVLVWFDTEDGRSLLLNAGYVPVPGPEEDLALADLPTGEVEITAVLRVAEPDDGRRDDGATRVTPLQMPPPSLEPIDGYAMVREACFDGTCVDSFGGQVPLPTLSLGPHLAYAWQWFALALFAPAAGIVVARRGSRGDTDDAPRTASRASRRSGPTDEEIEDAL